MVDCSGPDGPKRAVSLCSSDRLFFGLLRGVVSTSETKREEIFDLTEVTEGLLLDKVLSISRSTASSMLRLRLAPLSPLTFFSSKFSAMIMSCSGDECRVAED